MKTILIVSVIVTMIGTNFVNCSFDPSNQSPAWTTTSDSSSNSFSDSTPASRPLSGFRSNSYHLARSMSQSAFHHLNSGVHTLMSPLDAIRHLTFDSFMQIYGKNYSMSELPRRMSLFSRTKKLVEESLRNFESGIESFMITLNEFSDWDDDELKSLSGVKVSHEELSELIQVAQRRSTVRIRRDTERIPAQKDWRTSGCISKPIDQKKCGCCWAIASIGVTEAKNCLVNGASPKLSVQQLIDCASSRPYNNNGCDGGWPTGTMRYIFRQNVLARDSCYQYEEKQRACRLNRVKNNDECTVSSSNSLRNMNWKVLKGENEILYHVAKTGPVAAVMQVTRKFTLYWKGVFDDTSCRRRSSDVDHAIQIVGYGTENGNDYWLIKNSWGTTDWGEDGYAKIKRGKNACSIGHIGWVVTG